MGLPCLLSTLQHCQIRNVYLFMLKLEKSCAEKSNEDSSSSEFVQHLSIFTM